MRPLPLSSSKQSGPAEPWTSLPLMMLLSEASVDARCRSRACRTVAWAVLRLTWPLSELSG